MAELSGVTMAHMANTFSPSAGPGALPNFLAKFDETACKGNFDNGVKMAQQGLEHPTTWEETKPTWVENYPGIDMDIPRRYHECLVNGYESVKGQQPETEADKKSDNTAMIVGVSAVALIGGFMLAKSQKWI